MFPTRPQFAEPRRVVFILPCCIGDVVIATAASKALRARFPQVHITWAIGSWSREIVQGLPWIDALLDTGADALPVRTIRDIRGFATTLRHGEFDMAISLVRSPRMSLAVALSGIRDRVGLDSAGRGFGYTKRVSVIPAQERHEGEIYLSVIAALGQDTGDFRAEVPVLAQDRANAESALRTLGIDGSFIVVNPAGGSNPGAEFHAKRYPPRTLAEVVEGLRAAFELPVVLVAGNQDKAIVESVQSHLSDKAPALVGALGIRGIGAMASLSRGYIGNDTGLTHLAAASGAPTIMIMGPSSPLRYAPFNDDTLTLWKPVELPEGGVSQQNEAAWDWSRDGISPHDALDQIIPFLELRRAAVPR
jgi:heptosyltransferase-2/heptosyltransferase-3